MLFLAFAGVRHSERERDRMSGQERGESAGGRGESKETRKQSGGGERASQSVRET